MHDKMKKVPEPMPKYLYHNITFKEVPNEVCLTLSLTLCGGSCLHCHTPELRKDIGEELTIKEVDNLMTKYLPHITTICFLGDSVGLYKVCKYIKQTYSVKIAIYSGKNQVSNILLPWVDFYKVGEYVHKLGGLDKITTNQIFYEITHNGNVLVNSTHKFQTIHKLKGGNPSLVK